MLPAPQLRRLPLNEIFPDPTQSRTSFDPVKMDELKASLDTQGQLYPILVHQRSANRFEIIAGERRYRAAKALGWKDISCLVYPTELKSLQTEVLSLVENLQRVDLNPIEEAKGYQLLQDKHGMHKTAIAEMVGKDRSVISRTLDLLLLPPEIQESVARATLTVRHVRVLSKITNLERQIAIARKAADEDWSVRETEEYVNQESGQPKPVGAGGASPRRPEPSRGPKDGFGNENLTSPNPILNWTSSGFRPPPNPAGEVFRSHGDRQQLPIRHRKTTLTEGFGKEITSRKFISPNGSEGCLF